MQASLCSLVFMLAFLGLFAGAALAEDDAGKSGPGQNRGHWCADNPQKCQELKSRIQEKCAQDPKRCDEIKSRLAERKAKCEANPEECKKKRDEMRKRREECQENPVDCQHQLREETPKSEPTN